jgi:phage-related protein
MISHVILNEGEPYRIDFATDSRGDAPAKDFLESLPERPRKKAMAWIELLKARGPNLTRPYADIVSGPIRELRLWFGRLEIRLLYFIHGRRILLTHGFIKKTREIPAAEIAYAERLRVLWLTSPETPS